MGVEQELVEETMMLLLLDNHLWTFTMVAVLLTEIQTTPLTGMLLRQTTLPMQEQFKVEFLMDIKLVHTTTEEVS